MKALTIILLIVSNFFYAQQDYHDLYKQVRDSIKKVSLITDTHFALMKTDSVIAQDSILLKLTYQKQSIAYQKLIVPLFKNLINKTFPDISFIDKQFNHYNLSDFSNQNVIVNYNYLYCKPCVDRIDSTLKIIENKNIKMIVLLNEMYRSDVNDLADYGDAILIGLMTQETTDLVSLETGDDKMFFLNKKRKIEYFDATESNLPHEKWLNFLRNYKSNE